MSAMTPQQVAAEIATWKDGDRVRVVKRGDLIESLIEPLDEGPGLFTRGGQRITFPNGEPSTNITYAEKIAPDQTVTWKPGDDWYEFIAQVVDGCDAEAAFPGGLRHTGPAFFDANGDLCIGGGDWYENATLSFEWRPDSRLDYITLHLPPEPDTSAWDEAQVVVDAEGRVYCATLPDVWVMPKMQGLTSTPTLAKRGPIHVLVDADGKAVQ